MNYQAFAKDKPPTHPLHLPQGTDVQKAYKGLCKVGWGKKKKTKLHVWVEKKQNMASPRVCPYTPQTNREVDFDHTD